MLMACSCSCVHCRNRLSVVCDCTDCFRYLVIVLIKYKTWQRPVKNVQTTLFIDRPFIMTCIWRIHGSKPYIFRWSLVYRYSVFYTFIRRGWVGGLSQMKLTSFEKNCHILRRSLIVINIFDICSIF